MRTKTMIFMFVTVLAIFFWDVYAILGGGKEASISHIFIEFAHEYPAIPFLMGFTMGHLFWSYKSKDAVKK